MKDISSSSPYLSSRKSANSASLLSPYSSHSSLRLWHDTLIFILVFSLVRSNSLFLRRFSSSVLLFDCFNVGYVGAFFGSVFVVCSLPLFTVWVWTIWPGKSRHCACVGEGHCWVRALQGRGAASSMEENDDTSQTLPLALIGCVDPWAVDSCIRLNAVAATGWSHSGFIHSWPVPYSTVRSLWQF